MDPADHDTDYAARDRARLEALSAGMTGSLKRRLVLWLMRWTLTFGVIAVVVHYRSGLAWLFGVGAALAVVSLAVMLSIHAWTRRRIAGARGRVADYARPDREPAPEAPRDEEGSR